MTGRLARPGKQDQLLILPGPSLPASAERGPRRLTHAARWVLMGRRRWDMRPKLFAVLGVFVAVIAAGAEEPKAAKPVRVLIQTDKGDIEVELDPKAPN